MEQILNPSNYYFNHNAIVSANRGVLCFYLYLRKNEDSLIQEWLMEKVG